MPLTIRRHPLPAPAVPSPPHARGEVRRPAFGARWRALGHRLHAWLTQPVHPTTLGVFRLLFGLCMVMQARHFGHMYDDFVESKLLLSYPGLGWVPPAGPAVGNAILLANLVAAVLVAVGLRTREATLVLCVTFSFLFLQCESFFNNHYILICHATLLGAFTDWGHWASVDAAIRYFREVRRELKSDQQVFHHCRAI